MPNKYQPYNGISSMSYFRREEKIVMTDCTLSSASHLFRRKEVNKRDLTWQTVACQTLSLNIWISIGKENSRKGNIWGGGGRGLSVWCRPSLYPRLMTFFELIENWEFGNDRFFRLRDRSGQTYIKTFLIFYTLNLIQI